jgi:hypothetical protein
MANGSPKRHKKRAVSLPDLDQAKSAVLNTLSSVDAQRGYRHAINEFIDWYCSEPRLSFNRAVVVRYRMYLEQRKLAPGTINLRLGAVRRLAYEGVEHGLLSPDLAAAFAGCVDSRNSGSAWEIGSHKNRPRRSGRLLAISERSNCATGHLWRCCSHVDCDGTRRSSWRSLACRGERSTGRSSTWKARPVTCGRARSPRGSRALSMNG